MIPVLYRFSMADVASQVVLFSVAAALWAYVIYSGWRGAHGPLDKKTGAYAVPTDAERKSRALTHGVIGLAVIVAAILYARKEGIPIHTYGVMLGTGFLSAVTVAGWLCRREWPGAEGERKRDQMFDLSFYVFISGVGGSVLLYNIVNYKQFPSGGLVFYGGLIAASATVYGYCKKYDITFLRLADIMAPTVSLGQAFGRLGCFSAGCCWGKVAPHGHPLAVEFPGAAVKDLFGNSPGTPSLAYSSMVAREETRWVIESTGQILHEPVAGAVRISQWVAEHGHTLPVHPTQLYESFGQIVLFTGLLALRGVRRFHGQIFGIYLMAYAILRSSVELFRGDVERGTLHGLLKDISPGLESWVSLEAWYNISISQFISLCLFALGAVIVARGIQGLRAQPSVDLSAIPAT